MINRENLKILSDGLLELIEPSVPIEGVKFDMAKYSDVSNIYHPTCGTVGCAIGWGPFFGIRKGEDEGFGAYGNRQLICKNNRQIQQYLFDEQWKSTDNTKRGAGLRIKYYLEYGLPEDWYSQMMGHSPLTYLNNDQDGK